MYITSLRVFALINDKLNAWRQAWSKYRIRIIEMSPIRLWVSGQLNSTHDDDLGLVQLLYYVVERVVDGDDNEIADSNCSIFLFT